MRNATVMVNRKSVWISLSFVAWLIVGGTVLGVGGVNSVWGEPLQYPPTPSPTPAITCPPPPTMTPPLPPTPIPVGVHRYYVSTTGDDSADGQSWSTAFRTLVHASQAVQEDSGDQVWVLKGTYAEDETLTIPSGVDFYGGFSGAETEAYQRSTLTNPTIIDGRKARQCVVNHGRLDGFHVTEGISDTDTWRPFMYGDGVHNTGVVYDCVIFGNGSDWNSERGGGIYNSGGSVQACDIYENGGNWCVGGGVCSVGGSIESCVIHDNFGTTGGGLEIQEGTVVNCLIYGNTSFLGGGTYMTSGAMTNCTIYGNRTNGYNIAGGGVWSQGGGASIITNCIIWHNVPDDNGGESTITYSCFGEGWEGEGNVRGNPLFVNTKGDSDTWDFGLFDGSPCVDTGIAAGAPSVDLNGNVRGTLDGTVCMGAFESSEMCQPGEPLPAQRLYVRTNGGDDTRSGRSWATSLKSLAQAFALVHSTDDIYEIWVGGGEYRESPLIENPARVALRGGFSGTEEELSQRDFSTTPSILVATNWRRCVSNGGTLDGFHVTWQSESDDWGGGILNAGTVVNCAVYRNRSDGAGGIDCLDSHASVVNCAIYGNTSSYSGAGGISLHGGTAVNCTVYGNTTEGPSYRAGGIVGRGSVRNCIVWSNDGGDLDPAYCDISYSCFGEARGDNGNVFAVPRFMNVSGDPSTWDFRLKEGSPCVDAGTLEDAPSSDIVGAPRPGGDGKICMGAYESPDAFVPQPPLPPGRLYVKAKGGADGSDGKSWETAFQTITRAIEETESDGGLYDIWVAEGTYRESVTVDVSTRVSLCGGFMGDETQLSQRDTMSSPTIIDGQYQRLCVRNSGLLDRCEITRGNGNTGSDTWYTCAGGISNVRGVVSNCVVHDNRATRKDLPGSDGGWGGGIYNDEGSILACDVYSNVSDSRGGGICSIGGEITSCTIHGNLVYYGGTDPYQDEYDAAGGGVYATGSAITNCTVEQNTAGGSGGGIFLDRVYLGSEYSAVMNCEVRGNKAGSDGGGIANLVPADIADCVIRDNVAGKRGGGSFGGGDMTECDIFGNTAAQGGGVFLAGMALSCTIHDNVTSETGGGAYANDFGVLANCLVVGNRVTSPNGVGGGGVFNEGIVIHCTVCGNGSDTVEQKGGGVYLSDYGAGVVINSIVWGNDGGDIYANSESDYEWSVSSSCYSEARPESEDDLAVDPQFVNTTGDPSTWDFQLREGSPCIDTGYSWEDSYYWRGMPYTDILGVPRPQGVGVDMGAYEWEYPSIDSTIWVLR